MTNSKKNSKSIIALVVMAVLLVASIVLAATGAWFTSKAQANGEELAFGQITVGVTGFATSASNTVDTANKNLMPGGELKLAGTITNEKDAAYVAYKISMVFDKDIELEAAPAEGWAYDKATKTLSYETKATAVASNGTIDLSTLKVVLPESISNKAATAKTTAQLNVIAVQQANTAEKVTAGTTTYAELVAMVATGD